MQREKRVVFRYLNDIYSLECKGNSYSWEQPTIRGTPPTERESHSCVFYRGQTENRPKLLIYGGMNGHRLGDLWSFHLGKTRRSFHPTNAFLSLFVRFLPMDANHSIGSSSTTSKSSHVCDHRASVCSHFHQAFFRAKRTISASFFRMFVFGGWVPLISSDTKEPFSHEKEWKCTNTLASFNLGKTEENVRWSTTFFLLQLETNAWELLGHECSDDNVPRARAGHCAVTVNTRMYIWSGRDGYRKAWNNQVRGLSTKFIFTPFSLPHSSRSVVKICGVWKQRVRVSLKKCNC